MPAQPKLEHLGSLIALRRKTSLTVELSQACRFKRSVISQRYNCSSLHHPKIFLGKSHYFKQKAFNKTDPVLEKHDYKNGANSSPWKSSAFPAEATLEFALSKHANGYGKALELGVSANQLSSLSRVQPTNMQDENLRMLDYYDDSSGSSELIGLEENGGRVGPYVVVTDADASLDKHPEDVTKSMRPKKIKSIVTLLEIGLESGKLSRQHAFDLYSNLPRPGVSHLGPECRDHLLAKLSQVDVADKNETSMMHYLTVFDDLHSAEIVPKRWQWATAIHLTGRCLKKVTISELEDAMRIWKRMEEVAGIKSDTITMNILLDIALKSGQLDLAELTVDEIRSRGLKFDRFTHLGIIYLKGLRGDGDGIRNAYRELVNANEVVDSMTLTCVIAALLNAGEASAAMNVYRRMLARSMPSSESNGISSMDAWNLGRIIAKFTRLHKSDPQMMEQLQRDITVRPNVITFINLIGHHANKTGELVEIAGLLDDMHKSGVPIHGAIFIQLFHGFSRYGNTLYTSWTKERLEDVWNAFKNLADASAKDVFVGQALAIAVLKAYNECFGKVKSLGILEELRQRWRMSDDRHIFREDWLKRETGLSALRLKPERNGPDILN